MGQEEVRDLPKVSGVPKKEGMPQGAGVEGVFMKVGALVLGGAVVAERPLMAVEGMVVATTDLGKTARGQEQVVVAAVITKNQARPSQRTPAGEAQTDS